MGGQAMVTISPKEPFLAREMRHSAPKLRHLSDFKAHLWHRFSPSEESPAAGKYFPKETTCFSVTTVLSFSDECGQFKPGKQLASESTLPRNRQPEASLCTHHESQIASHDSRF